jgi:hypothetical protein
MEEMKNRYKIVIVKPEGKSQLGDPRTDYRVTLKQILKT